MPYWLEYEKSGKTRKRQFNSYYEWIKATNKIRKDGIEGVKRWATGAEKEKKDYTSPKVSKVGREKIKNFLQTCDNIKDLHNYKTKMTKKNESEKLNFPVLHLVKKNKSRYNKNINERR